MKRRWLILVAAVAALVLIGLIVKVKFFSKEGPGALQVSASPRATVFVDGQQVGVTPFFDDNILTGEHLVKIVPESAENDLIDWEGKVTVSSNILTVVNRELAVNEASSAGEILSLEEINQKDLSSLSVISIPDGAVVKVNGEPEGFAPVLVEGLEPGDYQVVVSAAGYQERTISAHTVAGFKMTVNVKLAQSVEGIEEEGEVEGEETEEEEVEEETEEGSEEIEEEPTSAPEDDSGPTATPPEKPYIKVVSPTTGWLKVRSGPGLQNEEITRIDDGTMCPYLEEEENGWYKIEYEEGEEGWVSGDYVELFD